MVLTNCKLILFLLLGSNLQAQYNPADSNYISAALGFINSFEKPIIEKIHTNSLSPNKIFYVPIDSLHLPNKFSTSTSSNSSSYMPVRSKNIFAALAGAIVAPFVAIGKALSSISKSSSYSSSSNTTAKIDTLPRVVPVFQSTLLVEMFRRNFYGYQASIYEELNKVEHLDISSLDSFPKDSSRLYCNKLIMLACYTADTSTLLALEQRKLFHVDSSFTDNHIKLNTPLSLASYLNDKDLLVFLMHRNVNPFIKSETYKNYLFSLGTSSGVHYSFGDTWTFNKEYNELTMLQLSEDKIYESILKRYMKIYKKQHKESVVSSSKKS